MSEEPSFKLVSSKQIYKNPWISLREDSVVRPGGENGIFGVLDVNDGAKVVALTSRDTILLAHEFKYGLDTFTLECIGGGIDEGETPEVAAKRELKEEAGAVSNDWTSLGYSVSLPTFMSFKEHLFLAQNIEIEHPPKTDTGEVIEIVEMPFTEAIQKISSGEIIQDSSIVAILRANLLLNQ